jgi:hypothetical protein
MAPVTPALHSMEGGRFSYGVYPYAGKTLLVPRDADADRLADVLLDSYASGSYSWLWVDVAGTPPRHVWLMVGPGIRVAISDEKAAMEAAD